MEETKTERISLGSITLKKWYGVAINIDQTHNSLSYNVLVGGSETSGTLAESRLYKNDSSSIIKLATPFEGQKYAGFIAGLLVNVGEPILSIVDNCPNDEFCLLNCDFG